jgi:hypothetical protein
MNPLKRSRQLFKASKVTVASDLDNKILNKALNALDRSSQHQQSQTTIWSTIMKYRKVEFVTATVILAIGLAVLYAFTGSIDGSSKAWASIIQRVESSHDTILQQLHAAILEKDMEVIEENADALSEFWQKLGHLMRIRLNPESRDVLLRQLDEQKVRIAQNPDRADPGVVLFYTNSDQFLAWIDAIEDESWLRETMYVCDQLEEYSEEIRDGARQPKLGMDYITHCMSGFEVYAQWFKQLPWNNTEQTRSSQTIVAAIKRDLTIARQELQTLTIVDPDRFAKRALEQVEGNIKNLQAKQTLPTSNQLLETVENTQDLIRQFQSNVRQSITPDMSNDEILSDRLMRELEEAIDLCTTMEKP